MKNKWIKDIPNRILTYTSICVILLIIPNSSSKLTVSGSALWSKKNLVHSLMLIQPSNSLPLVALGYHPSWTVYSLPSSAEMWWMGLQEGSSLDKGTWTTDDKLEAKSGLCQNHCKHRKDVGKKTLESCQPSKCFDRQATNLVFRRWPIFIESLKVGWKNFSGFGTDVKDEVEVLISTMCRVFRLAWYSSAFDSW